MRKIGIMQPYFFPYIGYWQLLKAVDIYIVYDDVTFIKGGWINRNRILVNGAPKYFNLKLSGASSNKYINEIQVSDDQIYKLKMLRTLEQNYRKAPYYFDVMPILEKIIKNSETNLAKFLMDEIVDVSTFLGIKTEIILSSRMKKEGLLCGEDRVIQMCKLMGGTEYYNAIGGRELYSIDRFSSEGITLKFLKSNDIVYSQNTKEFFPNLSIIDVMMFNSKETISQYLGEFELL